MKKKRIFLFGGIICTFLIWLFISGWRIREDVVIYDFSVSENGDRIMLTVMCTSSIGHVRAYKNEGGEGTPHYLKFYSAWGGFNSTIGAKKEYDLKLNPNDSQIYFYHGNDNYDLVLEKDRTSGEWHRV